MRRRTLVAGLTVVALLVAVIGVLYAFGAPTPGSTVPAAEMQPSPPVEVAQAPQGMPPAGKPEVAAASGEAPAPDPSSPLAISIPGCKCHSDDPKLVKEHESYRMNQCAGCHAGKTPTGQ